MLTQKVSIATDVHPDRPEWTGTLQLGNGSKPTSYLLTTKGLLKLHTTYCIYDHERVRPEKTDAYFTVDSMISDSHGVRTYRLTMKVNNNLPMTVRA